MSENSENNNGNSKLGPKDSPAHPLNETTVVVGADGSLTIKGTRFPESTDSKMPEIIEKLNSPDFDLAEVNRLIAIQIALIARAMNDHDNSAAGTALNEGPAKIAALRALARAAEKAESLENREVFYFDGPKFQFVFDELLHCYEKAATEVAGKGTALQQRFIKNFRDKIAIKETEIRHKTAKIVGH